MESFYFWAALYFKILVISIGLEAAATVVDTIVEIGKRAKKSR